MIRLDSFWLCVLKSVSKSYCFSKRNKIEIIGKINLDSETIIIPQWIKNNAGLWAAGQITDSDFVSEIEYLVNHKIITY